MNVAAEPNSTSKTRDQLQALLKDESFSNLNFKKMRALIAAGLGEAIGVSIFMFLGCGNVIGTMKDSDAAHLNTVLSFALGIVISIIVFNPISGSILNPALNVAAVILGHMSLIKMTYYTICQLTGSIIGTALVRAIAPKLPDAFCVPHPTDEVNIWISFAVEFVSTSILAFVFCHVLDARIFPAQKNLIFVKFGLTIIAIALPVAKWTGCSMNPARILGPAIFSNYWEAHWIYWTAPICASVSVAFFYRLLFEEWRGPSDSEKRDPA